MELTWSEPLRLCESSSEDVDRRGPRRAVESASESNESPTYEATSHESPDSARWR
jgi:hypothetical protein